MALSSSIAELFSSAVIELLVVDLVSSVDGNPLAAPPPQAVSMADTSIRALTVFMQLRVDRSIYTPNYSGYWSFVRAEPA